jgi:pimeloyl-ACP methyl ester carboxylesterase
MLGGLVATVALLVVSVAGGSAGVQAQPGSASAVLGGGFHHGFVRVDGELVHFVRGGSGPPLVLLHGWPQTWWAWHEVMPDLAQDHTVIAFDLPGLGRSGQPDSGFDKVTTAGRIREAARKLGYPKVDLLTHDVGALIAYPYAHEFPGSVGRVMVLDTPLSGFGLEDFYDISFHFLFNIAPEPIPEEIIDNDGDVEVYLGMLFDGTPNPGAIDRRVYFRGYADPDARSAGYEYYRAFEADAAYNQANAEPKISTPVLAMGGEFAFGPVVAASFGNVAADVRQVVAPGSGHFIPEENPQFLADCARLFLGPVGVPAPRPELAGCVA